MYCDLNLQVNKNAENNTLKKLSKRAHMRNNIDSSSVLKKTEIWDLEELEDSECRIELRELGLYSHVQVPSFTQKIT